MFSGMTGVWSRRMGRPRMHLLLKNILGVLVILTAINKDAMTSRSRDRYISKLGIYHIYG